MKRLFLVVSLIVVFHQINAQISCTIDMEDSRNLGVDCNNAKPATARVKILPGAANLPYTYLWWPSGETNRIAENLPEGHAAVKVTDNLNNDTIIQFDVPAKHCHLKGATVFTPNDDGDPAGNDTWEIANAQYFPDVRILIFNRLGQKVYEHREGPYTERWDGRDMAGVPLPDGAYYYVIYEDKSDKSSIVKGCVSIIR